MWGNTTLAPKRLLAFRLRTILRDPWQRGVCAGRGAFLRLGRYPKVHSRLWCVSLRCFASTLGRLLLLQRGRSLFRGWVGRELQSLARFLLVGPKIQYLLLSRWGSRLWLLALGGSFRTLGARLILKLGRRPCYEAHLLQRGESSTGAAGWLSTFRKLRPLYVWTCWFGRSDHRYWWARRRAWRGWRASLGERRLLPLFAWSGVGHLGWRLWSPLGAGRDYLWIYRRSTLLGWCVWQCLGGGMRGLREVAGRESQFLRASVMWSLAGLPPLVGFQRKIGVLQACPTEWPSLGILLARGGRSLVYSLGVIHSLVGRRHPRARTRVYPWSSRTSVRRGVTWIGLR